MFYVFLLFFYFFYILCFFFYFFSFVSFFCFSYFFTYFINPLLSLYPIHRMQPRPRTKIESKGKNARSVFVSISSSPARFSDLRRGSPATPPLRRLPSRQPGLTPHGSVHATPSPWPAWALRGVPRSHVVALSIIFAAAAMLKARVAPLWRPVRSCPPVSLSTSTPLRLPATLGSAGRSSPRAASTASRCPSSSRPQPC